MGHESDKFLTLFNNNIKLLSGGVESGFKHVEPTKYQPRLLHVKGKKKIRVTQVDLNRSSLNSGDVFILDHGLKIYQFNGSKAGPMEKQKGAGITRALKEERKSQAQVIVVEETDSGADAEAFWGCLVGGKGTIKTAEEGGSDDAADKAGQSIRRLMHLSDASGKMEFKLIAEGLAINKSQFKSDDVMIFDSGVEVYTWIGKGASKEEKKNALGYAQSYLKQYSRPEWTPISRVQEVGETAEFLEALKH